MGTFKEITGDLFVGILNGDYDVVCQGVNAFNYQGAGIVIPFKRYFNTDKFPMELKGKGDINKLGQIDYKPFTIVNTETDKGLVFPYNDNVTGYNGMISKFNIYVCNLYSQYNYGFNHADGNKAPIDYEALTLCLRKINKIFNGKRVGLPAIGTGLAGGDINIVREIMKTELVDCDVTLVMFDK